MKTFQDGRIVTLWLIRFVKNPNSIEVKDKDCRLANSVFPSFKPMNKKRMKWPYVQSYGEDTSIPESMVPVTAISGGIRIHDEDLGKDLPFINEAVVYANSKYTLMDTDPAAYKATYAFDGLLTIRTGVCGDNTDFPKCAVRSNAGIIKHLYGWKLC